MWDFLQAKGYPGSWGAGTQHLIRKDNGNSASFPVAGLDPKRPSVPRSQLSTHGLAGDLGGPS